MTRYILATDEAQYTDQRRARVIAVQRVLAGANWQELATGRTGDEVSPSGVADRAFTLVETGF